MNPELVKFHLPTTDQFPVAVDNCGTGRFAVGAAGRVAWSAWSGRQSDRFGAVVAVASVVPVSPLVSMARRVSTVNRGLLP
jgi:hypothetical protein